MIGAMPVYKTDFIVFAYRLGIERREACKMFKDYKSAYEYYLTIKNDFDRIDIKAC